MKSGWGLQSTASDGGFLLRENQRERSRRTRKQKKIKAWSDCWMGSSVSRWRGLFVGRHFHTQEKYVYNGLSEVSPQEIVVTCSVVAGVDLKWGSQGSELAISAFCAYFSHPSFCLIFPLWLCILWVTNCFFMFFVCLCRMGKTQGVNCEANTQNNTDRPRAR